MARALVLLLIVLSFQASGAEQTEDSWFSRDKVLHLSLSTALVSTLYHFHQHKYGDSRSSSEVFAVQITLYLSVGKEMRDRQFSYRDLLVDLVGIGVGWLLFVR
jgi:uncharacterized protein YfiM (DUF2279 family)